RAARKAEKGDAHARKAPPPVRGVVAERAEPRVVGPARQRLRKRRRVAHAALEAAQEVARGVAGTVDAEGLRARAGELRVPAAARAELDHPFEGDELCGDEADRRREIEGERPARGR